jgi:pyruvate,orthophosphate dikinase
MIPLVGFKRELDLQVAVVHEAAKAVMAEQKVKLTYSVGTMIEIPRGALTADEIAQTAVPPQAGSAPAPTTSPRPAWA